MSHLRTWITVLSRLTLAFTSPIYTPQFKSDGIEMNIRNLSCVSTRTGETGICTFANICKMANGTHLSICVDRFYFGSCCKLQDEPEVHLQENTIEAELGTSPFVTTDSAIDGNDIPNGHARPKPIIENQPVTSATLSSSKITEGPFLSTAYTTMQPEIGLSTFQTVLDYFQGSSTSFTTESVFQGSSSSSAIPQKPSGTKSTTLVTTNGPNPTSSIFAGVVSPVVTTTKTLSSVTEPAVTQKPVISSTTRFSSMTERTLPPMRSPPKNPTTTRPIQVTTSSLSPTSLNNASLEMPAMTKTTARPQQLTTNASSTSSLIYNITPSTNQASNLSISSLLFDGTMLSNESTLPAKLPTTAVNSEGNTLSTHSPVLETSSSCCNDEVNEATEISSTLYATTQEAKPPNSSASTESNSLLESARPTIPSITLADSNIAGLPVPTDSFNMSDYKQVCGMRLLPETRIVGGGPSTFEKWPWQLSLQAWNSSSSAYEHSCGAALLTDNWSITAAHCVENVSWKHLLLRIGAHDLNKKDEPYASQERRVQFVFRHPQFDQSTYQCDLALLRFDKPLEKFQPNILPICLPDDDEYYEGHQAFVTGWGKLYKDGPLTSVLHEVSVPVISNTVCEGMYNKSGYKEYIPNTFICAGQWNGGVDSCEGDSGGPLVIQRARDKRWILAGVITWGIDCGAPYQPGVYTRVSKFRKWITRSIQLVNDAYLEAEALV